MPSLSTLFSRSIWQIKSNLSPMRRSSLDNLAPQKLIFLFSPNNLLKPFIAKSSLFISSRVMKFNLKYILFFRCFHIFLSMFNHPNIRTTFTMMVSLILNFDWLHLRVCLWNILYMFFLNLYIYVYNELFELI